MKLTKTSLLLASLLVLPFVVGVILFQDMPSSMATHWDINGDVNGYMPKFWGLFFLPIFSIILVALLKFLPKIDPRGKNIEMFRDSYERFIVFFLLFMLAVHTITVLWNMGIYLSIPITLSLLMGALFYSMGSLLEKSKKNWFIGIRTPWTLSSEKVWESTHKLGAKLFRIAGLISALGAFFPAYSFYVVIVSILVATIYVSVFSYFEYRKEEGSEEK
ncbi:SdpI family protein [Candidatus Dojkabacteria bacterium]|nr:SdpI family protein [Candidatus Dojkabacteria bacterium]